MGLLNCTGRVAGRADNGLFVSTRVETVSMSCPDGRWVMRVAPVSL